MEKENKKNLTAQSINQSIDWNSELLIEDSNFYKLLKQTEDQELIKMFNSASQWSRNYDKYYARIKSIDDANKVWKEVSSYDFVAYNPASKLNSINDVNSAKQCLSKIIIKKKMEHLRKFFGIRGISSPNLKVQKQTTDKIISFEDLKGTINFSNLKAVTPDDNNILKKIDANYDILGDKSYKDNIAILCIDSAYKQIIENFLDMDMRANYLSTCFSELIKKLPAPAFQLFFVVSKYVLSVKAIIALLDDKNMFDFFIQFHHMLEKNLPDEDKQLFYDYLKSCRKKLQNTKNDYRIFNKQVKNLTAIFILGIIASATVLTVYFMGIYAATCFFGLV